MKRNSSKCPQVRIMELEEALKKCLKAVEDAVWGWDGDCGIESTIEWIVSDALEEVEK